MIAIASGGEDSQTCQTYSVCEPQVQIDSHGKAITTQRQIYSRKEVFI